MRTIPLPFEDPRYPAGTVKLLLRKLDANARLLELGSIPEARRAIIANIVGHNSSL